MLFVYVVSDNMLFICKCTAIKRHNVYVAHKMLFNFCVKMSTGKPAFVRRMMASMMAVESFLPDSPMFLGVLLLVLLVTVCHAFGLFRVIDRGGATLAGRFLRTLAYSPFGSCMSSASAFL